MTDLVIRGYRGDVPDVGALVSAVDEAATAAGVPGDVQVTRADRAWDEDHVRHAANLAARAHDAGRGRARTRALEFACHLAGEHQIGRALARVGVERGRDLPLLAVGFGAASASAIEAVAAALAWRADATLRLPRTRERLLAVGVDPSLADATPPERWGDLVLERVALAVIGGA